MERGLALASLACATLMFLALSIQQIWNVDLWWQLRTGQWILDNRALPTHDFFSWRAAGREWIELRWIFCVLAYAGWRAAGAPLLILAQVLVLGAAFATIAWPVRRVLGTPLGVLVLGLGIAAASDRFVVRPELVSFLLVAVFLVVLQGAAGGTSGRAIWLLPLLQALWVNSHTLFVLGPILAWAFAIGQGLARPKSARGRPSFNFRLVLVAALVTAACWINPYGTRGALFPLVLFREIQSDGVLARSIQEFRSPFALPRWDGYVYAAFVLAAATAFTFLRDWRRSDLTRLGLWIAFLYLAVLSTRNIALFALVSTWAALLNTAGKIENQHRPGPAWLPSLAHACLALLSLFAAWYVATDRFSARMGSGKRFGLGVVEERTPRQATDFLLASGAQPRLFNDLVDGSYLIWRATERFQSFVDGRLEVHGEPLIAEYLYLCGRSWEGADEWNEYAGRSGIRTVMLHRDYHGPLLKLLLHSPDWPLVHLDARNVVFVRNVPEHRELIERQRIDLGQPWLDGGGARAERPAAWRRSLGAVAPSPYPFELAKMLLQLESPDNAARALEAGLERHPQHAEMRWTLAQIYRSQGRDAEADRLATGFALPPAAKARSERLLANLLWMDGKAAEAVAPLERAIAIEPADADLIAELGEVCLAAGDHRKAASAYRRAVALRPEAASYWSSLGIATERAGDKQAAIDAYRQALERDPSLYRVHNQLGILLAQRGEFEEAAKCLERALQIKPDYPAARANLERLRSR